MIVIVALFCFLTLVSRLLCFCWYFCSQIKLNVLLHCLIDLWLQEVDLLRKPVLGHCSGQRHGVPLYACVWVKVFVDVDFLLAIPWDRVFLCFETKSYCFKIDYIFCFQGLWRLLKVICSSQTMIMTEYFFVVKQSLIA